MTRPATTGVQEELYASVRALAYADAEPAGTWDLLKYLSGVAAPFDEIEDLTKEQADGTPGWAILVDPDRCPAKALPWLAQFVGIDLSSTSKANILGATQYSPSPYGTDVSKFTAQNGNPIAAVTLPSGSAPQDPVVEGIISTAIRTSRDSGPAGILHTVTGLTPGKTYVASVDVFTFEQLYFQVYNAADLSSLMLNWNYVTNGWSRNTATFVAPAGGSVVLNPAVTPGSFAQFYYFTNFSVREQRLETDAEYEARLRARVKSTEGWKRGTPASIVGAAQQLLLGTKKVILQERDGDPYFITVVTYASETPDPAKVLAAIMAQKPAGLILTYAAVGGYNYLVVRASYKTYQAVKNAFATYGGLRNNIPGT